MGQLASIFEAEIEKLKSELGMVRGQLSAKCDELNKITLDSREELLKCRTTSELLAREGCTLREHLLNERTNSKNLKSEVGELQQKLVNLNAKLAEQEELIQSYSNSISSKVPSTKKGSQTDEDDVRFFFVLLAENFEKLIFNFLS